MLTGARCEECNHALPLKGARGDFRLPPKSVLCPGCGHDCATILPYRVGWMEALLFKSLLIASVPLSVAVALLLEWDTATRWLILGLGPVVGGGIGGLLLSRLLGFPLTLLRDGRRRRA